MARRATSCPRACRPRRTSSGRRGRAAPRRAPRSPREQRHPPAGAEARPHTATLSSPRMASTTLTEREERIKEQRRSLPDSPGVYLFRDSRKRVLYVGKAKSIKKRVAGALQQGVELAQRHGRRRSRASSSSPPRPRPRRCSPSRTSSSSTGRSSTSGCATTSRTRTSRSRSTRSSRASTSRARSTGATARTSGRSRTRSGCARRSTCSARSSSTAPATAPSRAARPGSPCLDYYIKRCGAPCVGYVSEEEYREGIDTIVDFLSGRYRQIERDLEQRDEAGVRARRSSSRRPRSATG